LSSQLSALRQHQIDPVVNDPQIQNAQREVNELFDQGIKADQAVENAQTAASSTPQFIRRLGSDGDQTIINPRYRTAQQRLASARAHAEVVGNELAAARRRLDALRVQIASRTEVVRQQWQNQVPKFEADFADENAKVAGLKREHAALTSGREDAIRRAVENAPDYVPRDAGLLARIEVLQQIGQENRLKAVLIVAIDFAAFVFEAAAVLAKVTVRVPTEYATRLALEAHMRVVRLVDEAMLVLNGHDDRRDTGPDIVPPDEPPGGGEGAAAVPPSPEGGHDPDPSPPKRPRGRPRKFPVIDGGLELPLGEKTDKGDKPE
jgi:hypothetical protein